MKVWLICTSCGKKYSKLIEPRNKNFWREKEREEKPYGECYECWQARRLNDKIKQEEEAKAYAIDAGLPPLTGTEKQVIWAEVLRYKRIKQVESYLLEIQKRLERKGESKVIIPQLGITEKIEIEKATEIVFDAFDRLLHIQDTAKFYIETKDVYVEDFTKQIIEHIETREQEKIEIDINAEATITPENKSKWGTVKIIVKKNLVVVEYRRDDDFNAIVKGLRYAWDGRWKKTINNMTGSEQERAAELICKLLKAGFEVTCLDNEAREKALKGDYEPEHFRWIFIREIKSTLYFGIRHEKNDSLYQKTKLIPESKYRNGLYAPIKYFAEIEDFATLYGFRITARAQEVIDIAKEQDALKIVVPDEDIIVKEREEKNGLPDILESDAAILDDLKDEDDEIID